MRKSFVFVLLLLFVLTACAEMEKSGGLFTQQELDNLRNRYQPIEATTTSPVRTAQAFCGDGIINGAEQCDPPGRAIIGGECTEDCRIVCKQGSWDADEGRCAIPVELKCPDAQDVVCGVQVQPLQGAGHCGTGTWCPAGQVCEGGSCVTQAPDEQALCLKAGGTWRTFPNSCADFCDDVELPEPEPSPVYPTEPAPSDLTGGQPNLDAGTTGGLTGYAVLGSSSSQSGVIDPSGQNFRGAEPNCPAIYEPVCGIDGQTYSNECSANVPIACEGECPCGVLDAQDVLDKLADLGITCESIASWEGNTWDTFPGTSLQAFPIKAGNGYRLQCDQEVKVRLTVPRSEAFQLTLEQGVNIISPSVEESVETFLARTGGRCTSVEEFDGSWKDAAMLEPGKGYRVSCSGTAVVDMPAPSEEAFLETKTSLPGTAPASIVGFPSDVFALETIDGTVIEPGASCVDGPAIESCDCGPNACWNGEKCVGAQPVPTVQPPTGGRCGDGIVQEDLSEECDRETPVADGYCDDSCQVVCYQPDYVFIDGKCQPPPTILPPQCPQGYTLVGKVCEPQPTVPAPQPSCPSGYFYVNGVCQSTGGTLDTSTNGGFGQLM